MVGFRVKACYHLATPRRSGYFLRKNSKELQCRITTGCMHAWLICSSCGDVSVGCFARCDLALLLGTGYGGQQWLWKEGGTRVLTSDKSQCWLACAVVRATRTDFVEAVYRLLGIQQLITSSAL